MPAEEENLSRNLNRTTIRTPAICTTRSKPRGSFYRLELCCPPDAFGSTTLFGFTGPDKGGPDAYTKLPPIARGPPLPLTCDEPWADRLLKRSITCAVEADQLANAFNAKKRGPARQSPSTANSDGKEKLTFRASREGFRSRCSNPIRRPR
jgi:hypothetical protein